jgi:hypothetical protein
MDEQRGDQCTLEHDQGHPTDNPPSVHFPHSGHPM